MMKTILLAGAAIAAISAAPAAAQDVDASLTFTNNIDTSIVTDLSFESDVTMTGDIDVDGEIDVDAAAVAVSDTKQVLDGQVVIYDEAEGEGEGVGDTDDDSTSGNFSAGGDVDSDGNVGANTAAGYYNQQSNIATIAVATGGEDDSGTEAGGMAQANTTAAQSLTGTFVGNDGDEDSMSQSNGATSGTVEGSGNIGSNSAAGAFNQQSNIMTLAIASDSSLAEASAGVVQWSAGNGVVVQDGTNFADGGSIGGAGNISVNTAAGVGNQQHNSLTVAASGAFGGNGTGGSDAGGL